MSSANDNIDQKRGVRAGFERTWAATAFDAISSDEALLRLAEARNATSKSANRFMLIAAFISILYFVRLQGLATELKLGEYSLAKLPLGLFVLAASALTASSVSLIRIGDSRSYDRKLMLACEKRYDCDCELRYLAFPNENAWGEPFSKMVRVIEAGRFASAIRELSLVSVTIFLMGLTLLPAASAVDFLFGKRAYLESEFQGIQLGLIIFLLFANLVIYLSTFWARLVDRN